MTTRASAPGKLFLLGEYAVLEGAPALLTAVDRRVQVTVNHSADDLWHLRMLGLESDAGEPGALTLHADGTLPNTLSASTRASLSVFDAVRSTLARELRGSASDRPLDILIDSTEFQQDGHKLGLGSSAAVATALTAALAIHAGHEPDNNELFTLAMDAHTTAQGGTGSGGDVATSVHGGQLVYVKGEPPLSVTLPTDLGGFAVQTGTGSATVDLVARVRDYAQSDPSSYAEDMGKLVHLARQVEAALTDANSFLALADDYFVALQTLDAHAKAGIVTAQHLTMREQAFRSGGVFKSSGAGGGDLGLVFSRMSSLRELEESFRSALPIPLSVNTAGWRREAA